MEQIKMVDLQNQYLNIKPQVDRAIAEVLENTTFINGPQVAEFSQELASFCGAENIVTCANGTDALQIAMMALGFKPGDEVIVPVHTYVATAEVISLLQLVPIFVDVDPDTFNIDVDQITSKISKRTVAIVPVHLYGQCANMEEILKIADEYGLKVIEDTAQALGAEYIFSDGKRKLAGSIGEIGTTSFFPSKNLGCFGDGGALIIKDSELAKRCKMIANHGQSEKYHHDIIGCNSRLDSLQAAVLLVKLKHLNSYLKSRQSVAQAYDKGFENNPCITTPSRVEYSSHVFHQYTIKVNNLNRDHLKKHLDANGIPSMIYYPIPLHQQKAFQEYVPSEAHFPVSEQLCEIVLSLPIHTEMKKEQQRYIIETINRYCNV